ncbi:hypothetical protein ACFL1X_06020 [Candidatus Hydrogenedentota bacterium]
MLKPLFAAIMIVSLTSSSWGKPAVAQTPKEALINFATAMDKGDVKGMMATVHYKDKKAVEAALTLIARMRELDKALEKEYGTQEGGWQSSGIDTLTVEKINSEDFSIYETGDTAKAKMWGESTDTPLLKVNGGWYIDMITDTPTGQAREQAFEMVKMMSKALKEAKAKIGKPGYTRDKVQGEFMGALMGSAMKQMKEEAEKPLPAEKDRAIRDVVNKFDKALTNPTVEDFKPLVHEHGQLYGKWFFEYFTKDYLEYFKSTNMNYRVKEIKRIAAPMPNQVSVEVTVAVSGPKGNSDKSGWLMFRKDEGASDWMFSGIYPEDLLFPKKPVPMVETSQFSKYVPLFPDVKFAPIADLFFQPAGGPVREVDLEARTGLKGTTTAPPNQVCEFYKQQMEGKWHDFKSSSWGGSFELSGWKLFPDGKKVGAFVDVKKDSKGSRVAIVLGVLPRKPGDENYVDKPVAKKSSSGSSLSRRTPPKAGPSLSSSKTGSSPKQKTKQQAVKSSVETEKAPPTPTLNANVDFKRGKFIINNGDKFDWTGVRMVVNGGSGGQGYVLRTAKIASGAWFSPKAKEFKSTSGKSYKSLAERLVSLKIYAATPKGNLIFAKKW